MTKTYAERMNKSSGNVGSTSPDSFRKLSQTPHVLGYMPRPCAFPLFVVCTTSLRVFPRPILCILVPEYGGKQRKKRISDGSGDGQSLVVELHDLGITIPSGITAYI